MHVLSLVNFKAPLILFVGNGIPFHCSYHHLVAKHEIIHHILQLRHKSIWIDHVEVYQSISCNLDSYISFDEIDETSVLHFVVENPRSSVVNQIVDLFEE
jgi:hypothetical protein